MIAVVLVFDDSDDGDVHNIVAMIRDPWGEGPVPDRILWAEGDIAQRVAESCRVEGEPKR